MNVNRKKKKEKRRHIETKAMFSDKSTKTLFKRHLASIHLVFFNTAIKKIQDSFNEKMEGEKENYIGDKTKITIIKLSTGR